ncbi:PfkB domain-containing protein [Aphelenchoides fujianensis]|nr:PfkB domain-containing protein [Aphelenchoides fujianensis]
MEARTQATSFQRTGGVARNHAECLQKLGVAAPLVSVVGDDLQADLLLNDKNTCPDHIFRAPGHTTASYLSLNVGGNIAFGLLSVEKLIAQITPEKATKRFLFDSADYVLLDSNLTVPALRKALDLCEHYGKKVWIEPTDLSKVNRFVEAGGLQRVHAFSPNALEFKNFCRKRGVEIGEDRLESAEAIADFLESHLKRLVADQMDFFVVTLGANGVVAVGWRESRPEIVSSTRAFLAAHLHGASLSGCVQAGTKCAEFSLRSTRTVPESVCFEQIVQPFL